MIKNFINLHYLPATFYTKPKNLERLTKVKIDRSFVRNKQI